MEIRTYNFAKFPLYGIIDKKTFVNPKDSEGIIVNTYNNLISQGKIKEAKEYIDSHPEVINMQFTSDDGNRLFEELRNTEISLAQDRQSIYYKTKPITCKVDDVFIGDEDAI